jgi:hypothetical protein
MLVRKSFFSEYFDRQLIFNIKFLKIVNHMIKMLFRQRTIIIKLQIVLLLLDYYYIKFKSYKLVVKTGDSFKNEPSKFK